QDTVLNPLKAGIIFLFRKRIGWLFALVLVNVISGAVIANFENTIEQMVSLVFFLPLLIDSGGNAGSQSATLMVRALATGKVQMKDWLKLIGKEVFIAVLLGTTMAVGVAAIAGFRAPQVLPVVGATMVLIRGWARSAGLARPLISARMGGAWC